MINVLKVAVILLISITLYVGITSVLYLVSFIS